MHGVNHIFTISKLISTIRTRYMLTECHLLTFDMSCPDEAVNCQTWCQLQTWPLLLYIPSISTQLIFEKRISLKRRKSYNSRRNLNEDFMSIPLVYSIQLKIIPS